MTDKRTAAGALAVGCALLASTTVQAIDWDGGAGDGLFNSATNWADDLAPVAGGTYNIDSSDTIERTADSATGRVFLKGGGTININGRNHDANISGASRWDFLGAGSKGTINQSGGTNNIGHGLRIGPGGGSNDGTYNLTNGFLRIYRGSNSAIDSSNPGGRPSLEIGSTTEGAGTALVEISGGRLTTRGGVHIEGTGTFSVQDSGATEIGIGSDQSGDGAWIQTSNSTLRVAIDAGGLTPIFVDDVDGGGVVAQFRQDSLLDVSFLGGHVETNAWLVLEAENGPIVD